MRRRPTKSKRVVIIIILEWTIQQRGTTVTILVTGEIVIRMILTGIGPGPLSSYDMNDIDLPLGYDPPPCSPRVLKNDVDATATVAVRSGSSASASTAAVSLTEAEAEGVAKAKRATIARMNSLMGFIIIVVV